MQTIYLDISNKGVIPTIYAKQGDVGRKFQVALTDFGVPYVPANGSAFSVWYAGASGEGNYTNIGDKSAFSVNGNKVTVEMIAQMLSNDGDGVLSLVLNDPNANQISTWNIPYICESVPGADSEEAKDYYTAFSKAVENLPYPDTSLSVAGKAADAAAVGAALSGKAPALDWSHIKWYVMGDSLTAQDNAFTNKRYYDFVQEKTGIQVIVDGVGATGYKAGESEGQSFLDRVKNIPEDVDIVTIFGSGNDLTSTDPTYANDAIYNTLAWILLNRTGLRVIVVPPAPWLGYNKREDPWKAYCDRLQACALTCNFRYVSDMYDCPPFNPNVHGHMEVFFTNDPNGVHPNEEGHKALAPYFYNALLEELALDESVVVSPGGSGGSGGAVDIPTALPNPHKLTFTGAVTAEYDGSKEVTVKIPEGGSGGGIEVTGASVGQTIVVKAVDDNGKPTEWETADLPQGGGGEWYDLMEYQTITEDISVLEFDNLKAKKFLIYGMWCVNDANNSLTTGSKRAAVYINNIPSYVLLQALYVRQSVNFVSQLYGEVDSGIFRGQKYQNSDIVNSSAIGSDSTYALAVSEINKLKLSFNIDGAFLLKSGSKLGVKIYV